MREYVFDEFGYFSADDCKALATALDGKTFMNFKVRFSNYAGNCTIILEADAPEYTEADVKTMFMHVALSTMADIIRKHNN